VICESTFDLYDEFIKVYKRKKMVRPFAEKKQAAMRDRRATGIAAGRKSRVSRIRTDSTASAEEDDRPLLAGGAGEDGEDGENEGEDQKAAAFISQARAMAGVGKIPDDAEWLTLYHQDEKTQQLVEGGKLAVSIQIVTKAELTARPSGFGRDDPNVNPFLPPPVGRMQLVRAAVPSPNHGARAALGLSQLCFLLLLLTPMPAISFCAHANTTEHEPARRDEAADGAGNLAQILLLCDLHSDIYYHCFARLHAGAVRHAAEVTLLIVDCVM
jgi:hypothetical protein